MKLKRSEYDSLPVKGDLGEIIEKVLINDDCDGGTLEDLGNNLTGLNNVVKNILLRILEKELITKDDLVSMLGAYSLEEQRKNTK